MKFCNKCGSLLHIVKKKKLVHFYCKKCKKEYKVGEKMVISETIQAKKGIVVIGKEESATELPITHIICPKCENNEAFWWMQQTRSADEPPTLFYKCKKCSYSWRSYG